MANKTKKVEVEEPQIQEEVVVETAPVIEQPKARERVKPKNEWEIKDRVYYLKGNKKPLSYLLDRQVFFILMRKKDMKEN